MPSFHCVVNQVTAVSRIRKASHRLSWLAALVAGLSCVNIACSQVPAPSSAAEVAPATVNNAALTDTQIQHIKTTLESRFPLKVNSIVPSSATGLYEVRVDDTELVYTNITADYVVLGEIIDVQNRVNITRQRKEQLNAINFSELPLDLAFKSVNGSGQRTLAVFEDPNCGYCKKYRQVLMGLKDVTIYTFPVPLLSPDSETKIAQIWCNKDKQKAWDDWMLRGQLTKAEANCKAPTQKMRELAQRFKITGTPTTLIQSTGKRLAGYLPLEQLSQQLNAAPTTPNNATSQ
jgi:thiol:disulfide interchange protein DsbC